MKKSLLIAILLIPVMSFAQNRAQEYINKSMKTDPNLQDAVVAI